MSCVAANSNYSTPIPSFPVKVRMEMKEKTLIPDANLFKEAFEKGQATNASLSSGSAPAAEESSASAPAETAPEPVNVCHLAPFSSPFLVHSSSSAKRRNCDWELTNRTLPRRPKRLRLRRRRPRESIHHILNTSLIESDSADAPSTHAPATSTETESESKEAPASSHIESHSKEEAEAKPFAPADSGSEKKEEITKEQEVAAAASKSGPTEEGESAPGAEAKKDE